MTWDGRPQEAGRDGWHWLQNRYGARVPLLWLAEDGVWRGEEHGTSSARSVASRWLYLGPCLPPAEVAAREAAARREGWIAARDAIVYAVESYDEEYIKPAVVAEIRDMQPPGESSDAI